MQIMMSNNILYSNIYHLTKFEFIENENEVSLKIDDLELLKEIKENNMSKVFVLIDDLCKKYSGILLNQKEFMENPIESNKDYKVMKMI